MQSAIHNGNFTERQLAKMWGVSQPQIHNVLKGEVLQSSNQRCEEA